MSQRSVCFCFLFVKDTDSYLEHPMQQVFQPGLSFFAWFIGLLNIILVCSFHSNCGKVALLHFFSLSILIFLEPTRMVLGGLSKCQSVYCTKKMKRRRKSNNINSLGYFQGVTYRVQLTQVQDRFLHLLLLLQVSIGKAW